MTKVVLGPYEEILWIHQGPDVIINCTTFSNLGLFDIISVIGYMSLHQSFLFQSALSILKVHYSPNWLKSKAKNKNQLEAYAVVIYVFPLSVLLRK